MVSPICVHTFPSQNLLVDGNLPVLKGLDSGEKRRTPWSFFEVPDEAKVQWEVAFPSTMSE